MNKKIAITVGDYNGIGPEITIKALNNLEIDPKNIIIIGNKKIFDIKKTKSGLQLNKDYEIFNVEFDEADYTPGQETSKAGKFSFECLKTACTLAKNKEISAITTAPVSKNALHLAGYKYSGQTEVIEHFLSHDGQKAEMLFTAKDFRVLLLTRHIPLSNVKITKDMLIEKVSRLNDLLKTSFNILNPSIALCSLNPHAGENGILGQDEINELEPAVRTIRSTLGINITNPLPADTLFAKAARAYRYGEQPYDCYIACYHDQGLIPIKTLAMEECVNTTIGLDIIRTSPAHGTAYDIAQYNYANPESMEAAITSALSFT